MSLLEEMTVKDIKIIVKQLQYDTIIQSKLDLSVQFTYRNTTTKQGLIDFFKSTRQSFCSFTINSPPSAFDSMLFSKQSRLVGPAYRLRDDIHLLLLRVQLLYSPCSSYTPYNLPYL